MLYLNLLLHVSWYFFCLSLIIVCFLFSYTREFSFLVRQFAKINLSVCFGILPFKIFSSTTLDMPVYIQLPNHSECLMCFSGFISFACRMNLLSTLINCLKSEDSNVRKVIWSTILFFTLFVVAVVTGVLQI